MLQSQIYNAFPQLKRQFQYFFPGAALVDQYKFVPAVTRTEDTALPHQIPDAVGDMTDTVVPCLMSVMIVILFKVINVKNLHGSGVRSRIAR